MNNEYAKSTEANASLHADRVRAVSSTAEKHLYRVTLYRTEYNYATVSVMAESEEVAEALAREGVGQDGISWKHADAEETIDEIELAEGGLND